MEDEDKLPDTLTPNPESTKDSALPSSPPPTPWGRLITCKTFLKSLDLTDSTFSFGRSPECTMMVTMQTLHKNILVNISKIHFRIHKCEQDNLVYITDLSKNGTFVNREKVGQGNKKILRNDDVISVSTPNTQIYVFMLKGTEGKENFLPSNLMARFAHVRQLGRGSCGEVHLVKDRKTLRSFAIKKIVMGESNSSQIKKINHPTKVFTEIDLLRQLSHPCVIEMHDIHIETRDAYLILEYMRGGELTGRILEEPYLSEEACRFYFLQMISGVRYLHYNDVIHRDLKPENMLLLDDKLETILKITDFGLSKIVEESVATTMCGTLRYVAPEVLRDSGYGKQVDIWSLGVILYYMMSRTAPFIGENRLEMRNKILNCQYDFDVEKWGGASAEVKDLIKKILVPRPNRRLTLSQIYEHPWIRNGFQTRRRVEHLMQCEGLEDFTEPPVKKFRAGSDQSSSYEYDETIVYVTREQRSTVCC